jgi:tripartite-type tricarboxylate transporter receptor subunit TctC
MNRRAFMLSAIAVPVSMTAAAQQDSSSWPSKTIRLVVPYAAGGPTDVAARLLAEALSQRLPQRVVVENITGAGTVVGTSRVAGAPKDGYAFLVATVAHAVNAVLYANLPFDPSKDFDGVALVGTVPQIVLVNNDLPVRSISDLIGLARTRPAGLTYGSAGVGSAQHLAAELLKSTAKIDMVHVPYRGSGPAVTDLIGGRLDLVIDSAATALQHIKAASVRAIAVTTRQRLRTMPDMPTVAEVFGDYEAYTWNAVLAPVGTPPAIVMAMNAAIRASVADPSLAARLEELGIAGVENSTPEATNAFVAAEMAKWQLLIRAAGITPN